MGPAIGSGPKEIFLSASDGQAALSTGDAGGITINHAATNAITIHGSGISLIPGAAGQGGDLEIVGINGSVNLDGVFNLSGPAHGGKFTVSAQDVVFGAGTIIRADAGSVPAALAGTIRINQLSDAPLNLNNSHLFSRGGAGAIYINSQGQINQSELGVISVAASEGDLPGVIVFSSRFDEQSAPVALLANLNGTITAYSPLGELAQGKIEFDAAPSDVGQFGGDIAVTGSANFIGSVTANGSSVSISTSRAQTTLSVSDIKANSGNVTLSATGSGSKIALTLPSNGNPTISVSNPDGTVLLDSSNGISFDTNNSSTLISAHSLTIHNTSGAVGTFDGTNASPLKVSVDQLGFTTTGTGQPFAIENDKALAISDSTSSGSVYIKAAGNITTADGSLRVRAGTLSIDSGASLGLSPESRLVLDAQTLKISTQGSAYISALGSVKMGDSTIRGDLDFSVAETISSSAPMIVKGFARISALNVGRSNSDRFQIRGFSQSIDTPPTIYASFLATGNANVNIPFGNIRLLNGTATGGAFRLSTGDNGTITLQGSIQSRDQTVLKTNGSGQIVLQSGSSIITAGGNVILNAGGFRNDLVAAQSSTNVTFQGAGSKLVRTTAGWLRVDLSGQNVLETNIVDGVNYEIQIEPGTLNPQGIKLEGTTIKAGRIAWLKEQDEDDSEIRPVCFQELLTQINQKVKKISIAHIGETRIYQLRPSSLSKSGDGLTLTHGKVFVHHKGKPTSIQVAGNTFIFDGDVVAEVESTESVSKVTNLGDKKSNSIRVVLPHGSVLSVNQGQRLAFGESLLDETPRRFETRLGKLISGKESTIYDVSIANMLGDNEYRGFLKATGFYQRIERTAVCLGLIKTQTPYLPEVRR